MMRLFFLLPFIALAACASADDGGVAEAELAAVRQVSMAGPALSWQDLRVHPGLIRRACSVGTLVNEDGQVVGYCQGGRQCRTNDWRPVEPGCDQPRQYRAGPIAPVPAAPARTPATQPGPSVDLARGR